MFSAANARFVLGALTTSVVVPAVALAGMPVVYVSDVASLRLETLSFFVVVFFAVSWVIQLLWNSLVRDFPRLPRLGYLRSVSLVGLWGLLFLVVLTMISGARELLTPGAWEKVGFTYKLAEAPPAGDSERSNFTQRRERLERLRTVLWGYAAAHNGKLPAGPTDPEVAAEFWQSADPSGVSFGYVAGQTLHRGVAVLAFEPPIDDGDLWVLYTNGEIRTSSPGELGRLLNASR